MTGLRTGATILVSVAGAVVLSWLAKRVWAKLARACWPTRPTRRRLGRGSISAPIPWTQLALRALAFASYTSMGIYLPAAGWEDDDAASVLEGSQVLMATVEGDTLVVDCLVRGDIMPTGDRRLWVPFMLRARLPSATASGPIPASLSRWVETGAGVQIWIGQRRDRPFVRLTGAGSQLTLDLRSLGQCVDQLPGMGVGQQ